MAKDNRGSDHFRRPRSDHAAEQAAQGGVATRPLDAERRSGRARREGAGGLSGEFATWMDEECDRLDKARAGGASARASRTPTQDALFHAAHDIKGEAATFGFPACAGAPTACAG